MKTSDRWVPLDPNADTVALFAAGVIPAGARVVEIGCLRGDDALWLATGGCDVVGVDLSATAIAYASRMAKELRVRARFVAGDAIAALRAMRAASADVVLDRLLLSNLPRRAQAACAREVARVLAPGGVFVLRYGVHANVPPDARRETLPDAVRREFRPRRGTRAVRASMNRSGMAQEAVLAILEKR